MRPFHTPWEGSWGAGGVRALAQADSENRRWVPTQDLVFLSVSEWGFQFPRALGSLPLTLGGHSCVSCEEGGPPDSGQHAVFWEAERGHHHMEW